MREIITDELVEYLAIRYQNHVEFVKRVSKKDSPYTFQQFVEMNMNERKSKTRKALDYIETKKA